MTRRQILRYAKRVLLSLNCKKQLVPFLLVFIFLYLFVWIFADAKVGIYFCS